MTNHELAMEFLHGFCAGGVDGLAPLLAEDLRVIGPYHRFASKAAYLESLRADPPEPAGLRVSSITEGDGTVAVFYDKEVVDMSAQVAPLTDHLRGAPPRSPPAAHARNR
jgi:hypothetical protein